MLGYYYVDEKHSAVCSHKEIYIFNFLCNFHSFEASNSSLNYYFTMLWIWRCIWCRPFSSNKWAALKELPGEIASKEPFHGDCSKRKGLYDYVESVFPSLLEHRFISFTPAMSQRRDRYNYVFLNSFVFVKSVLS